MASVRKRVWTSPSGETKQAWVVTYTDRSGKRRLVTKPTKKEADRERLRIEVEIEGGTHVPKKQGVSISILMQRWLDHCDLRVKARDQMRARTVRSWRSIVKTHVDPTIGTVLTSEITVRFLQSWIDDLFYGRRGLNPRSQGTLKAVVGCVRMAIRWANREGWLGFALALGDLRMPGSKPPPRNIPSKDEIRALLSVSGEVRNFGGTSSWLRPLLHVAVFTGLRQGEIRALRWQDVDFCRNSITVCRAADNLGHIDDPKSQAGFREVPMAPPLITELKAWKISQGKRKPDDLVFVTRHRTMIDPPNLREAWMRLQHRVDTGGEPFVGRKPPTGRFRFHDLRHVAASLLIETGLPPKRIQAILGHASIEMTFDRYGHLFEDDEIVTKAMANIGRDLAITA